MLPLLLLAMLLEAIILVIARGANRSIVRWLRLWIHPRLLPHQCKTHVKCISSCSFAVAVDAHVDMSLQHCCCSCWPCFWKIARLLASGYHLRGKPHHSVVVEAMEPSQMAPTSMSNTCKVYFIIMDTCYGCACGCILTMLLLLAWPCFWKIARILVCHPRGKPQHYSGLVEAMDPSQIAPTSTSNMCKVYFIIFRWCGCARGCVILTTLLLLTLVILLEDDHS